ncbi:hypothetical protein RCL_jg325.t1 [Rhizophagus clarus]|uniref:Uncharacterized protein n=1 Tax=Rhizophagus clarus TaxID=94130 RepID=A0A8H3QXD7_9GLOM|nr:hypothetical protein RCL_jg325.t1 [Rhizophagus clarus]
MSQNTSVYDASHIKKAFVRIINIFRFRIPQTMILFLRVTLLYKLAQYIIYLTVIRRFNDYTTNSSKIKNRQL